MTAVGSDSTEAGKPERGREVRRGHDRVRDARAGPRTIERIVEEELEAALGAGPVGAGGRRTGRVSYIDDGAVDVAHGTLRSRATTNDAPSASRARAAGDGGRRDGPEVG